MHCKDIENHLTDYLNGDLRDPQQAEVTKHLEGCADCRGEFESLKGLWGELQQVPAAEPDVDAMRSRFLVMVDSSDRRPRSAMKSWRGSWPVLRVALVMAFLTLAVFAAQQKGVLDVVISRLAPQQATQPVTPAANGTLAGRLLFPDGGAAANMRIAAIAVPEPAANPAGGTPTLETQTDVDGRYRLEKIPPGRYYVTAGQADFLTYYPGSETAVSAKIVVVTGSESINDLNFPLTRMITVKVYGHVIRADNQVPASNERLGLSVGDPSKLLSTSIGRDGSFEFLDVRPGNYQILASQTRGLSLQSISVADKDLSVDVAIPQMVNVTGVAVVNGGGLLPRYALEFTGAGSAPTYRASVVTREDGNFVSSLPSGEYRVTAAELPVGYSLRSMKSASVDLQKDMLKISPSDAPQILVTLGVSSPPPWVSVRGRVNGLTGGIPVTGFYLTSTGSSGSFTNSVVRQSLPKVPVSNDGSFEIPMVLPGSYSVELIPRYAIPPMSVVVPAGRGNVSGIEIALPSMKQVTGRILWEGDGPRPLIGFVLGSGPNQRISAGADANWRFNMWVPEGVQSMRLDTIPNGYTLRSLTYGDLDLLSNPLTVSKTDTAELQVVLAPAKGNAWVKVSGKVIGMPSGGANTALSTSRRVSMDTPSTVSAAIARDDTFEFPKVLPGTYILRATVGSVLVGTTTVVVGNTDVTGIEIQLPRQVTVSGHATMEGNGPPPRVGLQLIGAFGSSQVGILPGPDGSFNLNLPEGEFSVAVIPMSLPLGVTARAITYGGVDLLQQSLKVSADKPEELRITFKTEGDTRPVVVSGYVVNGTSGMPIALHGPLGLISQTKVGPDLAFEFQTVFPGRYSLRSVFQTSVPGSSLPISSLPGTMDLVVGTADVTNVEFIFPKQAIVTVRTVVEDGAPVQRFSLQFGDATGRLSIAANTGTYRLLLPVGERQLSIPDLPVGYVVKSLTYGSTDLLKQPLKILENDTPEILVTLAVDPASLHKISGRVTGLSNATKVFLLTITGPVSATLPLSANGTFESPAVPAGNYTAKVSYSWTTPTGTFASGQISVPVVVGSKDVAGLEIAVPEQPR